MVNYMEVFEVLPQPCLLLEPDGESFKIWNMNRAFLEMTGVEKNRYVGSHIEDIAVEIGLLDNNTEEFKNSLVKSFRNKSTLTLEPVQYRFRKEVVSMDDECYWSIRHIPVDCETPEEQHFLLTIFTDVTSQVKAKKEHCLTLDELANNTARSRHFIDQNPDGLFCLDRHGNFNKVNEGLLNIADISEKELLQMNFLPFCEDHHAEMISDHFHKALSGEKRHFRADFISAKGKKVVLEISLIPLKLENRIEGVCGIAKNITEKFRAEQKALLAELKLIESEKKFKAMVQEGSDLIAILDAEGYYKFVSDSVSHVLGSKAEDYLGKLAFDFIHPDDRERVYQEFLGLFNCSQLLIAPFRFENEQKEWRWIESKATNLLDDPNIQGIIVNSKDVTEAYIQKKQIEQLNERHKFVAKATEDLIYDWNIAENTIDRSKAFWKNLGFKKSQANLYPEDFWVGRIHEEERARVKESFHSFLEDKKREKWIGEYRFFRANGELAYLIDRAFAIRDQSGKAVRVVGAVLDVTETKEYLNKIEEKNKILTEMAWEQAHVIRAPLARLKTLTTALEDPTFDTWNKKELIELIKSSADELDEILLSRIRKIEAT